MDYGSCAHPIHTLNRMFHPGFTPTGCAGGDVIAADLVKLLVRPEKRLAWLVTAESQFRQILMLLCSTKAGTSHMKARSRPVPHPDCPIFKTTLGPSLLLLPGTATLAIWPRLMLGYDDNGLDHTIGWRPCRCSEPDGPCATNAFGVPLLFALMLRAV